ncbi:MAG: Clp protease N-terminal domain-containing protein [Pseudolysinimonas sp.]
MSGHQGRSLQDRQNQGRDLRALVEAANDVAARRAASALEPEHLLIAMTSDNRSRGGEFLIEAGLTAEKVEQMLDAERARSLGAAGVGTFSATDLIATPRRTRPKIARTSREAFDRGFRIGGHDRQTSTLNLVVGILMPDLGTVARMFEIAGLDRHQLLGRATAEVAKGKHR